MTNLRTGLIWAALSSWTNNILSFVIVALLARLISPTDFGLVALASTYIAFGQIFLSDSVSEALVQRKDVDSHHLDVAFWSMALLGLLATVLGIFAAPLLAFIVGEKRIIPILDVLSVRLTLDALLTVPTAVLLRRLDFKTFAARSFLANVIGGIAGIVTALFGGGAWALVVQQLANAAITVLVVGLGARWLPRLSFSTAHAWDLFPYSAFTMLTRSSYFVANNVDRIIIGHLLNPAAVGFYSLSKRIVELITASLTGVVATVAHPLFSQGQDNIPYLRSGLISLMDRTIMVAFPAFIGLAAISDDAIPLVFGENWRASAPTLCILSVLGALYTVSILHGTLIRATGRSGWWSGFTTLTSLLLMVGFFAAGPYGLTAIAASSLLIHVLIAPIHFRMVLRLLQMPVTSYLGIFVAPLVATSMMYAAVLLLQRGEYISSKQLLLKVSIEISVGVVVYSSVIFILAPVRVKSLVSNLRRVRQA